MSKEDITNEEVEKYIKWMLEDTTVISVNKRFGEWTATMRTGLSISIGSDENVKDQILNQRTKGSI